MVKLQKTMKVQVMTTPENQEILLTYLNKLVKSSFYRGKLFVLSHEICNKAKALIIIECEESLMARIMEKCYFKVDGKMVFYDFLRY